MAVVPDDVRAVAPELTPETDTALNLFIGFAEESVNRGYFKTNEDLAVILMTAHLMTLSRSKGRTGGVRGVSVGQMSRTYGSGKASDDSLDDTSYGKWFKQLRRQYPRVFLA